MIREKVRAKQTTVNQARANQLADLRKERIRAEGVAKVETARREEIAKIKEARAKSSRIRPVVQAIGTGLKKHKAKRKHNKGLGFGGSSASPFGSGSGPQFGGGSGPEFGLNKKKKGGFKVL